MTAAQAQAEQLNNLAQEQLEAVRPEQWRQYPIEVLNYAKYPVLRVLPEDVRDRLSARQQKAYYVQAARDTAKIVKKQYSTLIKLYRRLDKDKPKDGLLVVPVITYPGGKHKGVKGQITGSLNVTKPYLKQQKKATDELLAHFPVLVRDATRHHRRGVARHNVFGDLIQVNQQFVSFLENPRNVQLFGNVCVGTYKSTKKDQEAKRKEDPYVAQFAARGIAPGQTALVAALPALRNRVTSLSTLIRLFNLYAAKKLRVQGQIVRRGKVSQGYVSNYTLDANETGSLSSYFPVANLQQFLENKRQTKIAELANAQDRKSQEALRRLQSTTYSPAEAGAGRNLGFNPASIPPIGFRNLAEFLSAGKIPEAQYGTLIQQGSVQNTWKEQVTFESELVGIVLRCYNTVGEGSVFKKQQEVQKKARNKANKAAKAAQPAASAVPLVPRV
jgi:hypothetical protein